MIGAGTCRCDPFQRADRAAWEKEGTSIENCFLLKPFVWEEVIPSIDKIKQILIEIFNVFKEGFVQRDFWMMAKVFFLCVICTICHSLPNIFLTEFLPHIRRLSESVRG